MCIKYIIFHLGSGVEGTETVTPASFHAELDSESGEDAEWAGVGDPRNYFKKIILINLTLKIA